MNRTQFFNHLFKFCEGSIELRAIPLKGDEVKRKFVEIDSIGAIDDFCKQYQNQHLYFGVGTRDGKGGRKENLVNLPAVWSDVDFKITSREIALKKLSDFPFKPSIIIKSGGGVHLYWLLKEPVNNGDQAAVEDINKRILEQLGGDDSSKDSAHVMRIPDTLNRKPEYNPVRKCEVSKVNDFYYTLEDFKEILPPVIESKETPESKNKSGWVSELMQGVGDGERNAAATKLAGYYINKLSISDIIDVLTLWNEKNSPPLNDKELQTIIKSVSRYESDTKKSRVDLSNVYTPARMIEAYDQHLKTLKKNRFITGIDLIDLRLRGVSGGEVLTIIARSGSFKTATLQNLLKNYVQNSAWGAVLFSLEMPIASMTERYLQMEFNQQGQAVEELFSATDRDPEAHKAMCDQFRANLRDFFIVPVRISLSDIPAYVRLIENEFNIKIGVIGIDYIGLMDGPGHNEYEMISRIATGLKTTAKFLSLPVIALCQTSRKGGTGYNEISLDMGRSSGQIEEAADFVLGLFQIEDDSQVVVGDDRPPVGVVAKILKNRKGRAMEMFKLDLNPNTFAIGPEAEKYKPKDKKSGF